MMTLKLTNSFATVQFLIKKELMARILYFHMHLKHSDDQKPSPKRHRLCLTKVVMKTSILLILLTVIYSALPSNRAFAEGGATSGGGHDLGVYAKRIFTALVDAIEESKDIYSSDEKKLIKLRSAQIEKILISDSELPTANEDHSLGTSFIQNGTAFSEWNPTTEKGLVTFQRKKLDALVDPIAIEILFAHELNIMAGIEVTGDYRKSDAFGKQRAKYWETRKAAKTICTFSILDKKTKLGGQVTPGKLLGTSVTGLTTGASVGGGLVRVYDTEVRKGKNPTESIIIQYVLGSEGYLRATVSRAKTVPFADTYILNGEIIESLTPEVAYYNPYDWEVAIREARLKEYVFGFIMVSCARLD